MEELVIHFQEACGRVPEGCRWNHFGWYH